MKHDVVVCDECKQRKRCMSLHRVWLCSACTRRLVCARAVLANVNQIAGNEIMTEARAAAE